VAIYTVGHSTRTLDEFVALLRAHGVTRLADVRTVPKSRRHPHFAGIALAESLPAAGIEYRHFAALGGLRKPRKDSRNAAWRHESFRGYADYMETAAFEQGIEELLAWNRAPASVVAAGSDEDAAGGAVGDARGRAEADGPAVRTAIMCAEAVWWQCHRQLIADALVARSVEVRHIMTATSAPAHALTSFARVERGRVSYPGLI
jgi:uncharacterized protein (DUF488 family)